MAAQHDPQLEKAYFCQTLRSSLRQSPDRWVELLDERRLGRCLERINDV